MHIENRVNGQVKGHFRIYRCTRCGVRFWCIICLWRWRVCVRLLDMSVCYDLTVTCSQCVQYDIQNKSLIYLFWFVFWNKEIKHFLIHVQSRRPSGHALVRTAMGFCCIVYLCLENMLNHWKLYKELCRKSRNGRKSVWFLLMLSDVLGSCWFWFKRSLHATVRLCVFFFQCFCVNGCWSLYELWGASCLFVFRQDDVLYERRKKMN